MKIPLKKFGTILMSRPAGREAFLVMKAYFKPQIAGEKMELDFEGVEVIAPSWLYEVLTGLRDLYGADQVVCLPSSNPTVIESLKCIA